MNIQRLAIHWLHRRFPQAPAEGPYYSFEEALRRNRMDEPALEAMGTILRGITSSDERVSPHAAGIGALLNGLSFESANDIELIEKSMPIFDSLYTWARNQIIERSQWTPGPV